ALDDFGSGLSSFAYLKNLPIDYLKIDGGLVRGCASSAMDRAICQSIQQIGKAMNVTTIAEFVETKQIADCVRDLGIDCVQGHLLHPPGPLRRVLPRTPPTTSRPPRDDPEFPATPAPCAGMNLR